MHTWNAWRKHSRRFAVAGMFAVILGVAVGNAWAAFEVCTTPPLVVVQGDAVFCEFTNAYAYGTVVIKVDLLAQDGTIIVQEGPFPMEALDANEGGHATCTQTCCRFFCRFEVTAAITGYGRGAINLAAGGVTQRELAGYPATCNPF